MRRMGIPLIVAVCIAAKIASADDSPWRPSGQPAPAATPRTEAPWAPSTVDTPKWIAASIPASNSKPLVAQPAIPVPQLGAEQLQIPVPQTAPQTAPPAAQPAPTAPQTTPTVPPKPPTKPLQAPPPRAGSDALPQPRAVEPMPPTPAPANPKAPVPQPQQFQPQQVQPGQLNPYATQPAPSYAPSPSNAIWGASPAGVPCPPLEQVTPTAALQAAPASSGVPQHGPILPGRPGTFGSPNITLSRDRHFMDNFGIGRLGEDRDTVNLGEGPISANRYFLQTEFLLGWMNAGNIPVLASTGTGSSLGYIGQPGTQTLLGPGAFGSPYRNGFRVRAGAWCDDCGNQGIDGSFFFLGRQSSQFLINSNQYPTITRPIFAPNFNQEYGELVAYPGLSQGTLKVETSSFLWGADVNYRQSLCRTCTTHSEIFAGYRHLNLQEDLSVTEFIVSGPNAPDPAGTAIVVQDSIKVRNRFNGGQIGYAFGQQMGRFDINGRASLAMGVNSQQIEINGVQNRTRPDGTSQQFIGGLLAAGPNIGTFNRNKFSVAPEVSLNVGYMLTPTLRTYVGYNFLYWSNVIRPGDQIDRTVDLSFVPNGPNVPFVTNRPLPTFKQSDLFVHSIQFGLELRW